MPQTLVNCSHPGCPEPAAWKVASPWEDGRFSELKTYGFACAAHADAVVAIARQRLHARRYPPGEMVGEVATYPLSSA